MKPEFINTELPDILELRDISQTYDGGKSWIIKDLKLLIEDKPNQGQFVVILGKSGCGKSTLLRYISGLQTPTDGEVLLNGSPFTGNMPMVFQQYSSLPHLSVLENVLLPLWFAGKKNGKEERDLAMEMIAQVGLAGHENKFAQYPILSGGQLQRVAIARSLISNPRIILMDEPFGALDYHTRYQMQVMLAKIWEKLSSTIIFVTHDVAEAVFLGDDIYIMDADPGRIIEHFPVDLPFHRDRTTRRSTEFTKIVHQIEDCLFDGQCGT